MKPIRLIMCGVAATAMLGIAAARQADGAIINISAMSSDETDPAVLSASLEFTVVGNQVTLTVTNLTSAPNEYNINEIYFNVTEDVGTLTQITGHAGWDFHGDGHPNTSAAGFGTFSYSLIDGVGENNPHVINPGDSLTWVFEFTGTATGFDFTTAFSTIPPGENPAVVAAKFVSGPDDDSAYGANDVPVLIPAPSAALLLLGVFAGARRRRR